MNTLGTEKSIAHSQLKFIKGKGIVWVLDVSFVSE